MVVRSVRVGKLMVSLMMMSGSDSPKAAATFSQLGWMFSTARMVRISRASFSAVQSICFWPLGILVRGFAGVLVGWNGLWVRWRG